jgi:hypothetical protein
MQFNYTTLFSEITELTFLVPDPVERLKRVEEIYLSYKNSEPVNGTDDEKDEWFKCMTLLDSNRTQLQAIISNKHFDDTDREEQKRRGEDDNLPKYEKPDYSIADQYKEDVFDVVLENNKGENIADWIQEFLSVQFQIPYPDVQIPIIAAFTLMNSLAAPDDDCYPRLWICGGSGSGKSRLSEFIEYFYGGRGKGRVAYYFGTQVTNAGIRNTIDEVGKKETATLFHWENVTPKDLISKLAEAYTVMLMNTRATANNGICIGTQDAGIQRFRLHTLWVLSSTSSWGNVGKEAEVKRRCITIRMEKADKSFYKLNNYSWKQAPFKHAALWTKEKIEKEFYPLLIQCKKISMNDGFPFQGSEYDTYYLLLASGVFTGVWSTIEEGLKICLKHKNLNDSNKIEGKPLEVIIESIIERRRRLHREALELWNDEPTLESSATRISLKHPTCGLKAEIEEIRGTISQYDLDNRVQEIMNNLGYRYEVNMRTKEQFYIKDTLD